MAIKSNLEWVEYFDAAIIKILNAQSVGLGDKTLMRAKLDQAIAGRDLFYKRYLAETGAGGLSFNSGIVRR